MAPARRARASVDPSGRRVRWFHEMNNLVQRVAPALVLCLAMPGPARAQGGAAPSATASSPLQYRSAFADYKPWRDIARGDWRALNDAVKGDSMPGMDMSGSAGASGAKAMPRRNAHRGHDTKGGRP